MHIGIVIPCYNGAALLPETLASVTAQTHADWRCVLVDDGSTDGTAAVLGGWADRDVRYRVVTQRNGGVARARNRGALELGDADALIFLDQDDVWMPDALAALTAGLDTHPECVAAHGLCRKVDLGGRPLDGDGGVLKRVRRRLEGERLVPCDPDEPTTFATLAGDGNNIYTPGLCLVRRDTSAAFDLLFDPSLVPSDDWDLWLRLSMRGPIAFVPSVVLDWRQHDANNSKDAPRMVRAAWDLLFRYVRRPDLTPEQRALVRYRYRRTFQSVIRHDAEYHLGAAGGKLRAGKPVAALGEVGRGVAAYARYVRLRRAWPTSLYEQPIPLPRRFASAAEESSSSETSAHAT
ncbi:MAG TPA: glycosyltransferase [Armatimonadaceae bacterium]|nr:glycosyltransferase [Armatimonadaceae bacterium]